MRPYLLLLIALWTVAAGAPCAWSAASDGKILVAWGMVNEPSYLLAPVAIDEAVEEPRVPVMGLEQASYEANKARKEALDALRSFEAARRRAQAAEDRRYALEQENRQQLESARLREQAGQERLQFYGSAEAVELAKLRERAAREQAMVQREREAAELARLREQANREGFLAQQEREAAELAWLRQQAENERLQFYGSTEAVELAGLRERAAHEHALAQKAEEEAEEANLRRQAAREKIEFYGSRDAADEADRQASAAAEQARRREREEAELAKLRAQVARERLEYYGSEEAVELGLMRERAARERQAEEAKKQRVEENRRKSFLPMQQSRRQPKRLLLAALNDQASVASDALPEIYLPAGQTAAGGGGPHAQQPTVSPATTGSLPVADYVVGAGDLLDISVWHDETLTKSVRVSPDGTFSFPLIGSVVAAGRTLVELQEDMARRITVFVPEPVVTVELKQADSLQLYVIGKVNNPGRFQVHSQVNVLQALAIAGGLNPFAEEDSIKVLRENVRGETLTYAFDYKNVMRGEHLEQNIRLQRGDVILVP